MIRYTFRSTSKYYKFINAYTDIGILYAIVYDNISKNGIVLKCFGSYVEYYVGRNLLWYSLFKIKRGILYKVNKQGPSVKNERLFGSTTVCKINPNRLPIKGAIFFTEEKDFKMYMNKNYFGWEFID